MIRPLFNHGYLNMETKSNNILVKKKDSNYRLLYENENNNLTMVGYSYMNPHLFFRLFKFSNKSILHSRIR